MVTCEGYFAFGSDDGAVGSAPRLILLTTKSNAPLLSSVPAI
jgi:hypothetical protein